MNKKRNIRRRKLNRPIIIISILILLLFLIIAIIHTNKQKLNKIGKKEDTLKLGETELVLTNIISSEPNPPQFTAGMIPIKYNGTNWIITTKEDEDWYDYSEGKWANVMLSDGYYKSELEVGIDENLQLASKNKGKEIEESQLGTIFTWIPRLTYLDSEVEFLKNTSIIEYQWTTESCFNLEGYGIENTDIAFEGIWVGQKEYSNATEVNTKNSEMNVQNNKQGLIANAKVESLSTSAKVAVQKLTQKYSVETNPTMTQNPSTMQYRQIIRIINTNNKVPLKITHSIKNDTIKLTETYHEYDIKFISDANGNKIIENECDTDENISKYTFYIVDVNGNIKKHEFIYRKPASPDLTGFNPNVTFYVTYDENGIESSCIPIGEKRPKGWYEYQNSEWANVVVRENGNENYFVWIPRYMYQLNTSTQTSTVRFVDLENNWVNENEELVSLNNTGWKLPDAFTWNGKPVWGYWFGKYKLRDATTVRPNISGGGEIIKIKEIATNANYTYELYIIKDGKRIKIDEEKKKIELNPETNEPILYTDPVIFTGDYTIKGVPAGKYGVNVIVKDSEGNQIDAKTKEISVTEKLDLTPDFSGFNKATTYYVVYNEQGQEVGNIPIGESEPEDWYDYDSSQWANIVVRDNGKENYFVWIPRYEYKLDSTTQTSNVVFIPKNKTTADSGYQIPDAFKWNGTAISGYWFGKYKLRNDTNTNVTATVAKGTGQVIVSSITKKVSSTVTYDIRLINADSTSGQYGKIVNSTTTEGNAYTFTNVTPGKYAVSILGRDSNGMIVEGLTKQIQVTE